MQPKDGPKRGVASRSRLGSSLDERRTIHGLCTEERPFEVVTAFLLASLQEALLAVRRCKSRC